MSGPILPDFDPGFFRELIGDRRRSHPTRVDAERALRVVLSERRTSERAQAWWTLALFTCGGGDIDLSAVEKVDVLFIGLCALMIRTIEGPRNNSRRALVAAVCAGDWDGVGTWLTDFSADHRRLRDSLAEVTR